MSDIEACTPARRIVSMLSMSEIGDRILAALTDTMGVSRAMVLLFDDGSGNYVRLNWEEQFARGGVGAIISSYTPVSIRGRILTHYAMIDNDDKIRFWREVGRRVHHAEHFDQPVNAIEAAQLSFECRENR